MIEQRERLLVMLLVGFLVIGLGLDLATGDVAAPKRLPAPGERIVEHTSFCPPPIDVQKASSQVTVAAYSKGKTKFSFDPQSNKVMTLKGPGARVLKSDVATSATGYGTSLPAAGTAQVYDPVEGAGAARCAPDSSTHWYFPEGSSSLGFDERLILFNPFPDEAVAQVTLFTPTGRLKPARLAEGIAVPAGETKVLSINEFVQPEPVLAAVVDMNRGRVIAWRASLVDPKEQPAGLQFTLGARNAAPTWYLPAGSIEQGIDDRISILNPSRDEAVLNISLVTTKGVLQPPKLVEVLVPPSSAVRLPLSEKIGRMKDPGGVGVMVQSTNEVEVIAERTLWYDLDAVSGVSSEVGSAIAQEDWLVPPALIDPGTDTLVLLNPGQSRVRVDISVLHDGRPPFAPKGLQDVIVPGGSRRRIELNADGETLLVTAGGPIVPERSATSERDASAVMGFPIP